MSGGIGEVRELEARILALWEEGPASWRLRLEAPEIARLARPGQFVMLESPRHYLRRPLGIAAVGHDWLELGLAVKGQGTREICSLAEGERLSVTGPLGQPFPLEDYEQFLLVGGGTGIYPLHFLLAELQNLGRKAWTALGFRTAAAILLEEDFRSWSRACYICTDDGSYGLAGTAIRGLEEAWAACQKEHGKRSPAVLCCGPLPMMRGVSSWAQKQGLDCYCSMEERMGCGYGICRGCAVPMTEAYPRRATEAYSRCCVEGPVYPAQWIDWQRL